MAALIPVPVSHRVDAAARPFSFTPAARLVADGAARAEAETAADVLAAATGIRPRIAAGPAGDGDIALTIAAHGAAGALSANRTGAAAAAESYELRVDAAGVRVVGADAAGVFYAIQTLTQLLTSGAATADAAPGAAPTTGPGATAWTAPQATVTDAPRFAYRGFMLDVARHFFPVESVLGCIDRAAGLKLNMLHLHLTDDQGWRLHLDARPALSALASGTQIGDGDGGFFTKADYARIVAYAASRHMTVVPEVDAPSHTHAIGLAYPELMEPVVLSDTVRQAVAEFGGGTPVAGRPYRGFAVGFSSLRAHDERTYEFLADVYGELAAMTPGPYLHVGGDEAHGTDAADFAEFMARATTLVADLGKTPIAWHEAGAAPGLSDETVGQYWGFVTPAAGMDEKARAFVRAGSRVILSPADAIYLDMKYDADSPTGLAWANGPTSVERSYAWEPTRVVDGIGEDDILGVEAALWTETVASPAQLDDQVFPRIASAAEIAWSPAPDAEPERTWASFRERLGAQAPRWRRLGIGFHASPNVPWTDGEGQGR